MNVMEVAEVIGGLFASRVSMLVHRVNRASHVLA